MERSPGKSTTDGAQSQAPDVLGITANCPNCPRWQNKYAKAKQTLAATLEKLQAANVRKEKVDRALNKELGKTHNILCQVYISFLKNVGPSLSILNEILVCFLIQARGILEQANQAGH